MVIDASIAFKLIFNEPGTAAAIELARGSELIAPTLLLSEVGNGLWTRVVRNELVAGAASASRLVDLQRLIRIVEEITVLPRAFEIAVGLSHPIYDCVYLALAEALDDELVTADVRFLNVLRGTPYATRVKELSA